jgi:hypothetical protein
MEPPVLLHCTGAIPDFVAFVIRSMRAIRDPNIFPISVIDGQIIGFLILGLKT